MMSKNSRRNVIGLIRESWQRRLDELSKTIDLVIGADVDGDKEPEMLISPGLKIFHKKSGILYTVVSVGPKDIILRTPEGERFLIDNEELQREYELA